MSNRPNFAGVRQLCRNFNRQNVVQKFPGTQPLFFEQVILFAQAVCRHLQRKLIAHARQHDGRADRLGQVIHRPEGKTRFFIFNLAHRRDKHHRDVLAHRIGLQGAAHFVAVHLRHHYVKQDQIGGGSRCNLQRPCAIWSQLDSVVCLQQVTHQRQILRRVIHHQNGRTKRRRGGFRHLSPFVPAGSWLPVVRPTRARCRTD